MGFELDIYTILILLLMAAALVITYLRAGKQRDRIQTHGVRVEGVVVRNKIQWGSVITVRPIVRFVTQEGQTIEALYEHGVAFAIPEYSKGATITVVYDKDNPTEFDITHAGRRHV